MASLPRSRLRRAAPPGCGARRRRRRAALEGLVEGAGEHRELPEEAGALPLGAAHHGGAPLVADLGHAADARLGAPKNVWGPCAKSRSGKLGISSTQP